jgi:predicted PurR-regulated permease PerM
MMSEKPLNREEISGLTIDIAIRLGLLFIVVFLCYTVISPFLTIVIWGAIMAVTLYPVHQWMAQKLFAGRGGIASTVIVLLGLAIIIGPVSLLGAASVESLSSVEDNLRNGTIKLPPPPESVSQWPFIGNELFAFWTLASSNLSAALSSVEPQVNQLGQAMLKSAMGMSLAVLQFSASIIVAGLFFGPGKRIVDMTRTIETKLVSSRDMQFIDLTGATIQNVARGVMGVALLQALAAGIGYLATDYPFGAVITAVVLILSILNLGPTLPVLLSIGYGWTFLDTLPAILFTVYMLPVGVMDNVLRPMIVAKGLPVPIAVMFVGVIGGALVGGLLGLFIGPVVLAVAYQLLIFWITGNDPSQEET